MNICYQCKSMLPEGTPTTREAVCPSCQAVVHCCLNCRLYNPDVTKQCQSPTTQWVSDHEKANFCDEFILLDIAEADKNGAQNQARTMFDKLFKDL